MGTLATLRRGQDKVGGARERVVGLHRELTRRSGVQLPVTLWDGTRLGPADRGFRLVLCHPWSLRAVLWPPVDRTPGEAYVEGDIDIEGDAVEAAAVAGRLGTALRAAPTAWAGMLRALMALPSPPKREHRRRARLRGRRHSPARDRAAIAFHYDLSTDFYRCFLDRQLVYSCAYFADPEEELEAAQARKLDVICRKLRLAPGRRLLDIGCGFGSLLVHAARDYGVEGLGVTLSRTQAEAGREMAAAAGVGDRVEIRLADYRELTGQFDAVASVGMFEHVGPERLGEYFSHAYRLTRPGGLFCNHGIVTGHSERVRSSRTRDFAATYVFPDGGLVPAWRAVREEQRAGFQLLDVEQLRPHYALTLQQWVARLEANRETAVAESSEADYRIWRIYMAGSAHGFASGHLGVVQILGARPGPGVGDLPLGRAWMLPADATVGDDGTDRLEPAR